MSEPMVTYDEMLEAIRNERKQVIAEVEEALTRLPVAYRNAGHCKSIATVDRDKALATLKGGNDA